MALTECCVVNVCTLVGSPSSRMQYTLAYQCHGVGEVLQCWSPRRGREVPCQVGVGAVGIVSPLVLQQVCRKKTRRERDESSKAALIKLVEGMKERLGKSRRIEERGREEMRGYE